MELVSIIVTKFLLQILLIASGICFSKPTYAIIFLLFQVEQLIKDESIVALYELLDHLCESILINLSYIRKHKYETTTTSF